MIIKKTLAFLLCATYLTTSPAFSMDIDQDQDTIAQNTFIAKQQKWEEECIATTIAQNTFIAKQQKWEEERIATLDKHAMIFYQAKKAGATKEQLADIAGQILLFTTVATLHPEFSQWVEVLPTQKLQEQLAAYKQSHELVAIGWRRGHIEEHSSIYKAIGSNIHTVYSEIARRERENQ